MPITVQVNHDDIRRHVAGKIQSFRQPSEIRTRVLERPHFVALFFAAKLCDEFQKDMGPEYLMPLSVYCELVKDDPYQMHMRDLWDVLRREYPARFGSLDFPPGKCRLYPQLQIADMFAAHRGKYGKDAPECKLLIGEVACDVKILPHELDQYVAIWNRLAKR